MKILDVTEFFSERGGGVRSHLTSKGQALCQRGHEHVIVAPGPRGEQPVGPSRLIRVGGPAMPYDPSYHLLWRPDAVRRVVAREHPDVLEIHSPYVAAMGALASRGGNFGVRTFFWHSDFIDTYRHVLLDRDFFGMRVAPRAQDAIAEPLWAWVRRITRACDATIVAAQWQVDKLRSHGAQNIVKLPFGVDKSTFRVRERSEAVRASFGCNPGELLLVGVGRFAIEKRWDVAIEAFFKIAAARPCRLVLFGDGPERARLEALAAGDKRVVFAGFEKGRERLADVLASADALVHACPYETFGLSIAEAVCCGLPVVVPDAGGAAEQALPGFSETYASLDAGACAEALLRLLRRDAAALRASAIARRDAIASVDEHFAQLAALYEQLIARRRM